MIIEQQSSIHITQYLNRIMEEDHTPSYQRIWIDKYHGTTIFNPQQIAELTVKQKEEPRRADQRYVRTLGPDPKTKQWCQTLNDLLLQSREPHPNSHGLEKGRNTSTYIEPHRTQKKVLSVSLYNAFSSVGKKRVTSIARHLLGIEGNAATFFGEIATKHGKLNLGNPLAPQLLNIQAYKMDRYLTDFVRKYGLEYSRFLDELTFSSAYFIQTETIAKIKRIISRCGWMIDNETVNIQSGNHFIIAGHVVVPREGVVREKKEHRKEATNTIPSINQSHTNQANKALKTLTNPSDRLSREKGLIRNLKGLLNRK
ncbi:hypothetical protein SAMN05444392_101196 [Seinonella peptonophila]|uniref:Reverse transcriptase (RNA-dependent DNA polymerase) n=1 Tax=Seinonella peptonophila TaxID=112248 RepID=A0A1M4SXX9_9BACL|nr:hypothetical protein [Seinonella peptonophila]SHE37020.1 hypothetical protein SAMN05444392_101196 [Seinonella peptonophila]